MLYLEGKRETKQKKKETSSNESYVVNSEINFGSGVWSVDNLFFGS